jgi:hypothetical protein
MMFFSLLLDLGGGGVKSTLHTNNFSENVFSNNINCYRVPKLNRVGGYMKRGD